MTTKTNTKKINLAAAKELCANAVEIKGKGYVCPSDMPGLVASALASSDFDLSDNIIDAIGELGFVDALLSTPELRDAVDQDAAWYFQGADAADENGSTWDDAMVAGQKHYETCWEELNATGHIGSLN